MKRFGNLYEKIISIENLKLADEKARKGKLKSYGVRKHDKNKVENIILLHEMLNNKIYKTSKYHTFIIFEPKEREIFQLPYFPDRIVHHAIMNILEPIWCSIFTSNTFSCIKGRGINGTMKSVKESLKDNENTKHCLKIDVKKYYPNIDHNILKELIRKKIKCKDTLKLLDEIIDSAPGVPIGNYLSQYFANIYLAYFDHWIKEDLNITYYFRYADDMVFFHSDKTVLYNLLIKIVEYLKSNLKLELKHNYQIFPINKRGLDFVGFVFYHTHTRMRKTIKKNFLKRINNINKLNLSLKDYKKQICGWIGWTKYSNGKHFIKTHIKNFDNII